MVGMEVGTAKEDEKQDDDGCQNGPLDKDSSLRGVPSALSDMVIITLYWTDR